MRPTYARPRSSMTFSHTRPAARAPAIPRRGTSSAPLSYGPLLRISLWRMAADQHVLTATMHHIIADAWSVNVLLREITTIYASLVANRPAALPPLPIQYGDYAAWERARVEGPAFERT